MEAITHRRYGPPEVLAQEELPKPQPKPDEILIRVRAVEVTKADCETCRFRFPVSWFWLPLRLALGVFKPRRIVLGGYFAGEVCAVGDNVSTVAVGEAVYGCAGLRRGAYAEYVALPASYPIVRKPHNFSFAEAAAVPLGGLNALHFMRLARISPGEQVLINGAGGSIGAHAVQIAKAMGAKVTAVDASHKQELLAQLGADRCMDYRVQNFTTEPHLYDVIFDMVVASSYKECLQCLAPGGRYLIGNPTLVNLLRSVWTTRTTDKLVRVAFAAENKRTLNALREMIEKGDIAPIVDRVVGPSDVIAAHHAVESEQRRGAIVMQWSESLRTYAGMV